MSEAVDRFTVPESLEGERVDRAVALVTGWSRADVQELVAAGSVTVDGAAVAKSRRLAAGETVEVTGEPAPVELPTAEEGVPFEVRHEDEWLAVVAKPAGVTVHPGAGGERGTLVHGLLARWPAIAEVGDPMRPGIVHRLDRDTSGVMAVALRREAYEGLVAALAAREVTREYVALVWGHPEPARGVVDAPVGRSERNRTRMAVTPSGREARTRYHVVETFPRTALVDLALDTGRTHQIRVHLAAIGHHVVGDPVYGGKRGSSTVPVTRPFLHARRLRFDHPVTGEVVDVLEPLPPDLAAALDHERAS